MIECCTDETGKKSVAQTGHIRKRRVKSLRCSGAARPCAACTVPLAACGAMFCAPCCPTGAKAGDNRWVLLWAVFPLFLPRREPTPAAPCPLFFPLSRRLLWFRVRTCRRRKLWGALWACPPTSLFCLPGSVFAALPCAALCGGFRPRTPAILLRAGTSCRSRAAHYNLRLDRRQGTFAA